MKGLNRPILNDEELKTVSGGKTGEIKVVINSKVPNKAAALRSGSLPGTNNEQLMKISCPDCGEIIEVNIVTVDSIVCPNPGCGRVIRFNG